MIGNGGEFMDDKTRIATDNVLIAAANLRAAERKISFGEAMKQISLERPELVTPARTMVDSQPSKENW